jgi:CRP-like cAMP-binding protein
MPLFAPLDDETRSALAISLSRSEARRGDVIFTEGEPGATLHLVLDGKVKISRASSDGRENLLAVLGPGDLFGELSLFDPGPRTATATALTGLSYASLPHGSLRPWLENRPQAAEVLLQVLARRLRRTNSALADMVFVDVPGRVAKALLEMSQRFGSPAAGGAVRVEHGLTQEELAQLVGASRETVNKALAEFASRGWLRLESRAVVLLEQERLARRAR